MSENEGQAKIRPKRRIYSLLTRTRFLHIDDALEIGKLRLFAGQYERGSGASATAYHYLDIADARVLLNDLAWGKAIAKFDDFKGTPARNGKPAQSRILSVNTKDGKTWVEVKNGPGQETENGAIKPAGEPDAVVSIPLSQKGEGRKLGFAVLAYIQAWEAEHLVAATSFAAGALVYGNGEPAGADNAEEQTAFLEYAEAHGGCAPLSREVLRAWRAGTTGQDEAS